MVMSQNILAAIIIFKTIARHPTKGISFMTEEENTISWSKTGQQIFVHNLKER